MKKAVLVLMTTLAITNIDTAHAENAGNCYWERSPSPTSWLQTLKVSAPASSNLALANIGQPMASYQAPTFSDITFRCPKTVRQISYRYSLAQGTLEDGYADVYRTNLPGVGVRFVVNGQALPISARYKNAVAMTSMPLARQFRIEFIRTSHKIATGTIDMDYRIQLWVNEDWNAGEIRITGVSTLDTDSYFSGCTGQGNVNVPMGRVSTSELGRTTPRSVDLEVLCTGLPAGSKLPVKVYFEGSSDGPGRLNLTPGGAQGVEIALTSDKGARLPFARASALDMAWTRTEATGELYRLPISAQYVRKGAESVGVGRADATLNYILEYN